jgi:hypothetical protein
MTLISTFSVGGFPILFGDLLITGPISEPRTIAVPALGEVQDFFGESGWTISNLRQKVNLISDYCAIAWAGSYVGAKLAITELRRQSSTLKLTCADILHYLNNESELKKHPTIFIGLIYIDGELRQFHWNAEELQSQSLGTIYVSGSGSQVIHEFSSLLGEAETFSIALTLGGMLLQTEYGGGDIAPTLLNMFGGGYEIAFFSNGIIQKLAEVTYVFWEAALSPDGVSLSHPLLVIKQEYAGDFLLIRSIRIQSSVDSMAFQIMDEQRHVIAPLFNPDAIVPMDRIEGIALQSPLLCHCIYVKIGNQMGGIYSRIQQYDPSSEPTITFKDAEGQIVFGFTQDIIVEIAKDLERFRTGNGE